MLVYCRYSYVDVDDDKKEHKPVVREGVSYVWCWVCHNTEQFPGLHSAMVCVIAILCM